MKLRPTVGCLLLLGSCALFESDHSISGSMHVPPEGTNRLIVSAAPPGLLFAHLQNEGPGTVTCIVTHPDGTTVDYGRLEPGAGAAPVTTARGDWAFVLTADAAGATVTYELRSEGGLSLSMVRD
jgi:hypothetical protein